MEDYEEFYKKQLARIQGEVLPVEEAFTPAPQNGLSLIQFHGIAVLAPLLDLERKKEMQQYKQKALDIELTRHNAKRSALLNRVQEILESVQVRKVPDASEFNPQESPNNQHKSKPNDRNGFVILPSFNSVPDVKIPCRNVEKTRVSNKSGLENSSKGTTEGTTPKLSTSPTTSQSKNAVCAQNLPSSITEAGFSSTESTNKKEESNAGMPRLAVEAPEVPDHYVMSLQNLLKKSREYIDKERERSQHNSKNNSRGGANESHSDKENDALKTGASIKERSKYLTRSRSCSPVIFDKKVNPGRLAHTSNMNGATLSSFSKVDIPVRPATPSTFDSDSDEELKRNFMFDNESSILRSLTGSYAKLPSPEPSLSPKMHRRRSRPSSAGHIVINNPVNAYELSPKEKERGSELVAQNGTEKITCKETVTRFSTDEIRLCCNKLRGVSEGAPETSVLPVSSNEHSTFKDVVHKKDSSIFSGMAAKDSSVHSVCRGPYPMERVPTFTLNLNEPNATVQPSVAQTVTGSNGTRPSSVLEWAKRGSPVELNKSYDVETPSPVLLQSQSMRQCVDLSHAASSGERSLQNSLDGNIKCKLDLEAENLNIKGSKEALSVTLGTGVQQEMRWLQEGKCHMSPIYVNSTEAPINISPIDEGLIKKRMFAFEELKRRLEEQHAQQLSELIAEQEKEQERLRKEMEQERRLTEKRAELTESVEQRKSNEIVLNWREKSAPGSLTPMTSPGDTGHGIPLHSTGFGSSPCQHSSGSSTATVEAPFYLWGPEESVVPKICAPKPLCRARTRWSQVPTPEMQIKFQKVTALAKGFLTRRLMQTEKLKSLRQTVKDTVEFIKTFHSEPPLRRGVVSTQDASLQERVFAQLRAALFEIHDIFFVMKSADRMSILYHDREVRKEKMLRQMEKMKSPRDRVSLSAATQKSLDRKKQRKVGETVLPSKKPTLKQKASPETRILQPNQGQNAPVQRLLCRQGPPKTAVKGVQQGKRKSSESRVPNKAVTAVYTGRAPRERSNSVAV